MDAPVRALRLAEWRGAEWTVEWSEGTGGRARTGASTRLVEWSGAKWSGLEWSGGVGGRVRTDA